MMVRRASGFPSDIAGKNAILKPELYRNYTNSQRYFGK